VEALDIIVRIVKEVQKADRSRNATNAEKMVTSQSTALKEETEDVADQDLIPVQTQGHQEAVQET